MKITKEVAQSIDSSVLCWLATVSEDGSPNVSPKEAFMHDGDGRILIAHIASPKTVQNISNDPRVCVSFVDIFTQRGHKVRGTATILSESDEHFGQQKSRLTEFIGDAFPILAVIEVTPNEVEQIAAPSYHMLAGATADTMIEQSLKTYRVAEYQNRVVFRALDSSDSAITSNDVQRQPTKLAKGLISEDETFLTEFEKCHWPLEQWHHQDHVKLGYLYLCRYPFDEALSRIRDGIKAHNSTHRIRESPTSGYHETMTYAWLSLIRLIMDEYGRSEDADAFYDNHPELSQKKTLRLFYSQERFMSPEAKLCIIEPDLTSFPCRSTGSADNDVVS